MSMRMLTVACAVLGVATAVPDQAAATTGLAAGLEQVADSSYGCLLCHADKRRSFTMGIHSERGIRCHDCHGGDPASFERAAAHAGRFMGNPTKLETVQLCSNCHADADQMRQYGLPADQLAEFRTSRHGRLLLERSDFNAPTCTDCHDAHTILPPEDVRSNVHPANIAATCARCHDDEALMGRYGLEVNQFAQYRQSAHGNAVFDEANLAAPTCTGCHGSHAALPPGVTEIVNVCDKCHVLIGRAFRQGQHGEATREGSLPGCLGCHSNHGTERIAPDRTAALCSTCHDAASGPATDGMELQEVVLHALAELAAAEAAMDDMSEAGHQVSNERFLYQTALTSFREMGQVHHSLDLDRLEDLSLQLRSNTERITATAEAHAEERWERKLLLVPVWFLTLSAIVFAYFKLREAER